jgi:HK97 family phage prohead protease
MTVGLERRFSAGVRSAEGRKLEGYAALCGMPTRINGQFDEVIAEGAFRSLGPDRDILALVDHDSSKLLARTKSGTLQLREDSKGLAFTLALPDTQLGRDVLALAQRGDLGGMSFGFTVPKGGEEWRGSLRVLKNIDLHEISVVHAWPAYDGTIVQARRKQPKLTRALLFMRTVR